MSALEALKWHRQFAEAWTEKRPVPLEMTPEEMFDWLGEHCDAYVYMPPTQHYGSRFILYCDGVKFSAPTLSGAVQLAAAKLEEQS